MTTWRDLLITGTVVACLVAAGCLATPKGPGNVTPAPDAADLALDAAADCFAAGRDADAVPHLKVYLTHHPRAAPTRFQLAEVCYRYGHFADARPEFQTLAQDDRLSGGQLAQCHARLAAIAEREGDTGAELRHRGTGLFHLVRKWDADPVRADAEAAERTLAEALQMLTEAIEADPDDLAAIVARGRVLERLGQATAAGAARDSARARLPDPALSPRDRDWVLADEATSAR